jgi:hypothetical protein
VLFQDASLVLEPKSPIERWTAKGMTDVYSTFIADHYVLIRETEHWRIYRRAP